MLLGINEPNMQDQGLCPARLGLHDAAPPESGSSRSTLGPFCPCLQYQGVLPHYVRYAPCRIAAHGPCAAFAEASRASYLGVQQANQIITST